MSDPAPTVTAEEVWRRLSPSVGDEVAEHAVVVTMQAVGLTGPSLTLEAALKVLEQIANSEGLLGVTARFARSRWMLQLASDQLQQRKHRSPG